MTADNYMLANESNLEPSSSLVLKSLVGREISHHCKYPLVTNEGTTQTCPVSSSLNGKKMIAVKGTKVYKVYIKKHGNFPYFFRMNLLPRKEKRNLFLFYDKGFLLNMAKRGVQFFFPLS